MGRFSQLTSFLPLSFFGFRFSSGSNRPKTAARLNLMALEERAVPAGVETPSA